MTVAMSHGVATEIALPGLSIPRTKVITKTKVAKSRVVERVRVMRVAKLCCAALATVLTVGCVSAGIFVYDAYSNFGLLIDQQISGGYLKGHAGLYAAPRV